MDIITVLSFTIFVATVVTLVMAAVSYGAFRIRERRKPGVGNARLLEAGTRPYAEQDLFFKKFVLPPEEPLKRDP